MTAYILLTCERCGEQEDFKALTVFQGRAKAATAGWSAQGDAEDVDITDLCAGCTRLMRYANPDTCPRPSSISTDDPELQELVSYLCRVRGLTAGQIGTALRTRFGIELSGSSISKIIKKTDQDTRSST